MASSSRCAAVNCSNGRNKSPDLSFFVFQKTKKGELNI